MEVEPFENPWIKKIRTLTHILIVSVAANIGLATAFLYQHTKKGPTEGDAQAFVHKQILLKDSNGSVLKDYFQLNQEGLYRELSNKAPLQDGLLKRDLALACLVNFHHFDLEKALSGLTVQRRNLSFVHQGGGERFDIEVFPGLDDGRFQMINLFSKREEWPLTTQGLFLELQKREGAPPRSLVKAFSATPEFYGIYTLLQHLGERVSFERVLAMILEGSWPTLTQMYQCRIVEAEDPESGVRQVFSHYVTDGSTTAAQLWIDYEGDILVKQLSDDVLAELIALVNRQSSTVDVFLKRILCSVRCDQVRKQAALKLYAFKGIEPPAEYRHEEALKVFLPSYTKEESKETPEKRAKQKPIFRKHLVAEGDSLWKIAKKYKVTIESLRSQNQLKTDRLKPGQELEIPR